LPGGDRTIEEHYQDSGRRKRLFLEIRESLRERAEAIRATPPISPEPEPRSPGPLPGGAAAYSGKAMLAVCERLGADWKKLADCLDIPPADQARFERGDEARGIWAWLHNREALARLALASCEIRRGDLAAMLDADA